MGRIWSNGSGLPLNASNLNGIENDIALSIKPWKANTGYTAGQAVLDPTGHVVTANANHTSGATYTAGNWTSAAAKMLATRATAGRRLPPGPLSGVGTTSPAFTDILGLLADGTTKVFSNSGFSASQIGISADGATFTWGKDLEGGNGIATSLVETPGGEVLVSVKHRDNTAGKIWRSTGWNPATATATTWTAVLTASGPNVHFDGRWCLTPRSVAHRWSVRAGAIFVCEYGYHISEAASPDQAAVRAYMSADDGATWTQIFDLRDHNTDTNAHLHAIAYDPWDDRVLITTGDNANAGVYYCDGENIQASAWTAITGTTGSSANQATTVIPMAAAIVLLSDSPNSAVRRIPRLGFRGYGTVETAYSIATGGTATIGAHAHQSDATGPLLMSVYSSSTSGPPAIYATTDGRTVTPVYTDAASVTSGPGIISVTGPDINGKVWAVKNMGGTGVLLTGTYSPPGSSQGVPAARTISTGPGLSGGGDLTADRTLTVVTANSAIRRGLIGHAGPEELYSSTSAALTDGTLYLVRVIAEDNAASAARTLRVWQQGAASGLTSWVAAVFDINGNQLGATSASDAGSATSHRNFAVGTFALTKGAEYYLGLLFKGTTGPTLARAAASAQVRGGLTGASLLWATGGTALAAMPASITPSSNTNLDIALWAAIL